MMKIAFLWLLTVGIRSRFCSGQPRVQAPTGTFVGNTSIADLDQFLGIPYAQPPIANLRFANPLPARSSPHETIDATAYGPGCSQLKYFTEYNGLSEDCLTLNVIRPKGTTRDAALPVMFWIHGGGNANGQSIFYNGTALVQHSITINHPIIYVGINYRLNGFGFLNSPAFQAAGLSNLGLKDQYLALQWAHENIEAFGGDPEKVTIFGESAGAANCWSQLHYAYVKNETNKYFRAMITESGAPGSPAFPRALKPRKGAPSYKKLLKKTGCLGKGISCLRKVQHNVISPILVNEAIADYTLDHDWFDADLWSLVETGQFAPLPIIHGTNLDEGSFFMPDPFNPPNRAALIQTVASFLDRNTQTATSIVDIYMSLPDSALGKGVKGDPTAPREYWVALALYTDMWMDLGKQTWLPLASEKANTWGYDFRQEPPLNSLNLSYEYPGASKTFSERVGVYHGSELPYVFGEATHLPHHTQGDVDVAISVMDAWISFAYYMNPNTAKSKFRSEHVNLSEKLIVLQAATLLTGHASTRAVWESSWHLNIREA